MKGLITTYISANHEKPEVSSADAINVLLCMGFFLTVIAVIFAGERRQ